jgi:hypothetical protein
MWNLPCIYQWLNQPARVALLLLFLMLTCVIAIAIGRIVRFHTIRMHARLFQQAVSGALHRNEIRQALAIADTFDKTPVAGLSPVGLTEFQSSIALLSKCEIIVWADRTLRRVRNNIDGQLKSGLGLMTN